MSTRNITMPPKSKKMSKPSIKKAKQMVGKQHKSRAAKNMDTFFLKPKSLYTITPTQGVTVANYVYGTMPLSGSNLWENSEFNFYRLQYDKFRVNSLTVKWLPKANVFDQAAAQGDGTFNLTGDGKIHIAIDRDGPAYSSQAVLSRYPSYKAFSVMKTWQRTYKVTYPPNIWLDCQNYSGNTHVTNTLGLGGTVTWYGENLVEDNFEVLNEPIASVELSWSIVFQGKTPASLTFDVVDGVPTSVTLTSFPTGDIKALSPLTNVRGTIGDTITVLSETGGAGVVTEEPLTDSGVAPTI